MANVMRAIKNKTNLVVHAPTGLGKTIATLVPAIEYAKKNDLKVLFLTSRNTQHLLAMQTLKDIKKETPLIATDLIGRKHLCSQALPNFSAGELSEYCKLLKKEKKCSYYSTFAKSSGNLTVEGKLLMEELQNKSPLLASEMIKMCEVRNSCPYEAAIELTKSSDVIVADYQFIFNTFIRKNLLGKINRELDDIILIIDEAHNLPNRIKNQASSYLTTLMLKGAINEARKYDMNEIEEQLKKFEFILNSMSKRLKRDEQEMYITKEDFNDRLKRIKDIDEIIIAFEVAAEFIREKDNRSRIGGVANFLIEWQNQDKGYTRILSTDSEKKNKNQND